VSGRHKKQLNNKSDMHHVEMYSLWQIVLKQHCKLRHVRKNGQWHRNMKRRIEANSTSVGIRGLRKGLEMNS
jgi:hypothetical protein